ncbi:MAG TPA: GNAT family N-acetyltransferase [Saprospiraceae bacterium]|nr:GNAT family N-acetyltransferase [Saprospiraceae bacterium]
MDTNATSHSLSFRPVTPEDDHLLKTIYESSREEEMAMLDQWPEDFKKNFIDQQFRAQHDYYINQFREAQFLIILHEGKPAGRLYIDRRPDTIHMIDITLLPPYRGKGYGEFLIRQLFDEAAQNGKAVSIYVERQNRALHLYRRMGFEVIDDSNEIYLLMSYGPV